MTATPRSQFVEARTRAEQERTQQQRMAVHTVASNARDRTDFAALLAMLGLEDPAGVPVPLSSRLAVYVDQVASAVGVSASATGHEVTDTATAYLALDLRSAARPGHDLMLVWDEHLGWYIAVETNPTETPAVVAYLDGDVVPSPAAVARFVTDTAEGHHISRFRPVLPPIERTVLADKMAALC
ncbi:DUF6292 family protein [Actinophytocola algeriensis]|uniref:DUF6292 domain-containing protein n=1 Tax=Actinophytocola algeriensis TaxID=1768010 RepID=A0A7W7Q7U7_9PSEU|nr:DUF6292 family protein [Actinophytocola algeriensis]MBB4908254.1 hypothetical protein [Actinophytocola algeriensis]MBE1480284.1 hypothetical protein [Actinophytocola algeriensis]